MKPTEAKCRIMAVQLGEAQVNFIRPELPPLRAKFALMAEDGSACGFFEKSSNWSDKAMEKLRELAEILEEDCLPSIFDVSSAAPEPSKTDEPPQF